MNPRRNIIISSISLSPTSSVHWLVGMQRSEAQQYFQHTFIMEQGPGSQWANSMPCLSLCLLNYESKEVASRVTRAHQPQMSFLELKTEHQVARIFTHTKPMFPKSHCSCYPYHSVTAPEWSDNQDVSRADEVSKMRGVCGGLRFLNACSSISHLCPAPLKRKDYKRG